MREPLDIPPVPTPPPSRRVRIAWAVGWLLAALLLSLGAAGIVVGMDRPPVDGARPELTWATDRATEPALNAAAGDLAALAADVDALGESGRHAIAALVGRDRSALDAAIAAGAAQVAAIDAASAALRSRLAAIPGFGPDDATRIGSGLRDRFDLISTVIGATAGFGQSWTALTKGSATATDLVDQLAAHDTAAAAAGKLGRAGSYAKALVQLDTAEAALVVARTLRDELFNTVDVGVLTEWIDRNAAYDTALRKNWTLLIKTNGRVTTEVRAAFDELRIAQANLPPDTRGLVVILGDIARGRLNEAVIQIEQARAQLADAAAAVAPGGGANGDGTGGGAASPAP